MSSLHFDLVTHWHIDAPVERVWAALSDPASWPRWWPFVRAVRTLRDDGARGTGGVRRFEWATRLPYRLAIDVQLLESVPNQRLRGRSSGQLEGEGLWLLQPVAAGATRVTYVWRVALVRRWMRWLAPLLAPVFRWNHHAVMRAGEAGLRRELGAWRSSALQRQPAPTPR